MTAVVTADNDFTADKHPVGEKAPVPSNVVQKIEDLVNEAILGWGKNLGSDIAYYPRKSFFGPTFRITTPGKRELYVFRMTNPFQKDLYYFILYDTTTKKTTLKPPYIYGAWMEGDCCAELRKPLLSFDDIDGDGQQEYVIQERTHNGTLYNAIVYHYYHVSSDLELRPILALETRLLVPESPTPKKSKLINRSLQKLGKGQIRLEVSFDFQGPPPQHRVVGFVVLHSPKPGSPFAEVERNVFDTAYANVLITGAEVGAGAEVESEAQFLIEGYRFYY